jgi:chaperonin GroES
MVQKAPKKKRIRPIRDFLVIHPEQPLKTLPGSLLVVPESSQDEKNPPSGIVVRVGCGLVEGGQIIPLKVKAGQRVYFARNSGTLIKNDPVVEDCFLVRENQLFGYADDIGKDEPPAFKMEGADILPSVESSWG